MVPKDDMPAKQGFFSLHCCERHFVTETWGKDNLSRDALPLARNKLYEQSSGEIFSC